MGLLDNEPTSLITEYYERGSQRIIRTCLEFPVWVGYEAKRDSAIKFRSNEWMHCPIPI